MEPAANKWWVSGRIMSNYMVCQYRDPGLPTTIWYEGNPLNSVTSLLMIQLSLIFIVTWLVYFSLRPLRQSMTVAQILAGIIIGPSFLVRDHDFGNKLFPPLSRYVLKTLSNFGLMLHLFIYGVKIDLSSLWKSVEGKTVFIGLSGFFVSFALGGATSRMVKGAGGLDGSFGTGVAMVMVLNSMSFFVSTTGFLNELKISNSEVGRLACAASFVVDAFGYFSAQILIALDPPGAPNLASGQRWGLMVPIYYGTMFFIFRPMILHIISETPEGQPMKRSHFVLVLSIVLLAWFWGECLGQRLATFFFGLSLPDGPPLGSILVQKLEIFTSGLLLPVLCTVSGLGTDVHVLESSTSAWRLELIFVVCHFGKFLGTLISSVFASVSIQDAIPLALLMCCQGLMEVVALMSWKDDMLLDAKLFSLSVVNVAIYTGVLFPLVQHLYDPSRGYNAIYRRSVLRSSGNLDLQMLVCIHNEDNVPAIIGLLEASKSSGAGSISVIALQLVQLTGRAVPILGPLHQTTTSAANLSHAEHIANAFRYFERHSQGYVKVQHFISVTPYSSMHNDICILSHDKRASLIIVPFHKQWAIDGTVEASSLPIREVNKRVLDKAPCSVAVLIDRGPISGSHCAIKGDNAYHIGLLFIGGADDHEALAIAKRMAVHPTIRLTVLWLRSEGNLQHDPYSHDNVCLDPDSEVITDFQFKTKGNDRITFKEKVVSDGVGTTRAVLSIQSADLLIVGRHHEPDCPAMLGITLWSEYPELGMLGDMLVSTSEFRFSVLVVQQQPQPSRSSAGLGHVKDSFGMIPIGVTKFDSFSWRSKSDKSLSG